MELRLLRDFLAVVESGSVGTAARSLGLSQPALSKAIHALEARVGAPLFERTMTGATPTLIGRALEPHAREILNGVRRAEGEIAELLGLRRGRVAVISGAFYAELLYPKVLRRFHAAHPQVEVVLAISQGEGVLGAVRANEAEVAFTLLDYARDDDVFATQTMVPDQRVIVVSGADHPLARRRRVTPREAWDCPWLLPRHNGIFRTRLAARFQRFGLPLPAPASIGASTEIQKHILQGGGYLAVLPELAVREELAAGTLRAIPVPALGWSYAAGAFYRKSVPLSPAARHLIEIARGVCREMAQPL